MATESLTIPAPFHLTLDTGELSVDYKGLRFGPKTRVADLDEAATTKAASFPNTDSAYVIGPVRLLDGRWFYINLGFSRNVLTVVGFGWGKLRVGFYENSVSDFQEQMQSYRVWLESSLGPSQPCRDARVVYRNESTWGSVQASYDSRTELPGIAIRFHPPKR